MGKKKYLLLVMVLVFILLVITRMFGEGETYEINAENFTSAFKLISFNQEGIQAGLIFRDGIYYLRLLDTEEEVLDEDE